MNYDVAIVGAGPAGGLAAKLLAERGQNVLLVEKMSLPRAKVCGCCFNGQAQRALGDAGLDHLLRDVGGRAVNSLLLAAGHRRATLQLPNTLVASRAAFDAALVESAVRQGVHFLSETRAQIGPARSSHRLLHLTRNNGERSHVAATIVLAADGLAGDSLRAVPGADVVVRHRSRVGIGTVLVDTTAEYAPGTIYMACGAHGYTGVVRAEGDLIDVASAVDVDYLKDSGSPAVAAAQLLRESRFHQPQGLMDAAWRGTPALTRRRKHMAFERIFVLGDSAGYVEPFTGDGIAWALWSAIAVVDPVLQATREWKPCYIRQWHMRHKRILGSYQRASRIIAELLRFHHALRFVVTTLSVAPFLVEPIVRFVHQTRRSPASVRL